MMQAGGCCDILASTGIWQICSLQIAHFVCPVARVTNKPLHVSPPTKPGPWQGASPCSTLPRPPKLSKPSLLPSHTLSTPLLLSQGKENWLYTIHARRQHGYLSSPAPPPAASGSSTLSIQSPNAAADQTRNSSTPCRSRRAHP